MTPLQYEARHDRVITETKPNERNRADKSNLRHDAERRRLGGCVDLLQSQVRRGIINLRCHSAQRVRLTVWPAKVRSRRSRRRAFTAAPNAKLLEAA